MGQADSANNNENDVKVVPDSTSDAKSDNDVTVDLGSPRRKFLLCVVMLLGYSSSALLYSLQAPFFPTLALKKGATQVQIGFVFGIYEIVSVICAPIWGKLLPRLGSRFLFVSSLGVAGSCSILFSFVENAPNGAPFLATAMAIRIMEGISTSAFITTYLSYIFHFFPDNASLVFGISEVCFGIGISLGPVIGSALYHLQGFKLPFVVMGCFLYILCVVLLLVVPRRKDGTQEPGKYGLCSVLKLPILLLSLFISTVQFCIFGSVDAVYANYLARFNLPQMLIGVMFLIFEVGYVIFTPITALVSDKKPIMRFPLLISGLLIQVVGLFLMGPLPLLQIQPDMLWLVIFGSVLVGIGASSLTIVFSITLENARESGLPDNREIQDLISGLIASSFSVGAFLGPTVGSAVFEAGSFGWMLGLWGFVIILPVALLSVYLCYKRSRKNRLLTSNLETETKRLISEPKQIKYNSVSQL